MWGVVDKNIVGTAGLNDFQKSDSVSKSKNNQMETKLKWLINFKIKI